MSSAPQRTALSIASAAALATACAVAMSLLLTGLSSPPDFQQHIAALEQKIAGARQVLRPHLEGSGYGADAVCKKALGQEVQLLRKDVVAQADAAKLMVSGLDIAPDNQTSLGETLAPLRLKLQAEGSYEGALSLMAGLARERPMIFVDTVDLGSKTSSVTLKLSGRVYCSAGT